MFSLLIALFMGLTVAQTGKLVFWSLFWGFIVVAVTVSTFYWIITNRFFVNKHNRVPHTDILSDSSDSLWLPEVEWGYAFDVHLNAFFPALLITGYLQLPFVYCEFFPPVFCHTFESQIFILSYWYIGYFFHNWILYLPYVGKNIQQFYFISRLLVAYWPFWDRQIWGSDNVLFRNWT